MSPGRSNFISRNLNQTAVYWANPLNDGWGGRTFDPAVEIAVLWQEKTINFIDRLGRETISRAVVHLSQNIDVGGYLYLGELADLSSNPDPKDTASAFEIKQFEKIPDLGGTRFMRKAYL